MHDLRLTKYDLWKVNRLAHVYVGKMGRHIKVTNRVPWSKEEDDLLKKAVEIYKGKNWKAVSLMLKTRTRAQCAHRWQKVLNPDIKKGAWTPEEDQCLINALKQHGQGKWSLTAESVPGRNGKQCRERWHNHLQPNVTKEPWSEREDDIVRNLRHAIGNKWATIAMMLPGRTENAIKNRWNAKLALERRPIREEDTKKVKSQLGHVMRKRSSSTLEPSPRESSSKEMKVAKTQSSVRRYNSMSDLSPFSSLSLLVQSAEILQAEEEKKALKSQQNGKESVQSSSIEHTSVLVTKTETRTQWMQPPPILANVAVETHQIDKSEKKKPFTNGSFNKSLPSDAGIPEKLDTIIL